MNPGARLEGMITAERAPERSTSCIEGTAIPHRQVLLLYSAVLAETHYDLALRNV
jgi:hypothetical protein